MYNLRFWVKNALTITGEIMETTEVLINTPMSDILGIFSPCVSASVSHLVCLSVSLGLSVCQSVSPSLPLSPWMYN